MFSKKYFVDRYLKHHLKSHHAYMTSTTRGKIEAIKDMLSTHYVLAMFLQLELHHAPGSMKVEEGLFKKLFNLYEEITSLTKSHIFCSHIAHLANLGTYGMFSQSDVKRAFEEIEISEDADDQELAETDKICLIQKLYK